MSHILTINVGSSSVKYDLFKDQKKIFSGIIEKIGGSAIHKWEGKSKRVNAQNYKQAFKVLLPRFKEAGVTIKAVGHRVVHGGSMTDTARITPKIIRQIKSMIPLAPLHNAPELAGIKACVHVFSCPHFAVFDTSFHTSIPDVAAIYPIPSAITKKYNIRRYGFHGINHKYLSSEAAKQLRIPLKKTKIITCHLGNGCSIAAVNGGKSIDTSMGFTPLEGLMMGTRCGDIDPALITFLMGKGNSPRKIDDILGHKSGLLGVSDVSRDMREILRSNKPSAKLAIDMFCYRIAKYISAYLATLGGADAIVFSAGIGEKANGIRKKILSYLVFAGVKLDEKKNRANSTVITTAKSKIKVFVIPANESFMIAEEVNSALK